MKLLSARYDVHFGRWPPFYSVTRHNSVMLIGIFVVTSSSWGYLGLLMLKGEMQKWGYRTVEDPCYEVMDDGTLCSLVNCYQSFVGLYCLRLQGCWLWCQNRRPEWTCNCKVSSNVGRLFCIRSISTTFNANLLYFQVTNHLLRWVQCTVYAYDNKSVCVCVPTTKLFCTKINDNVPLFGYCLF